MPASSLPFTGKLEPAAAAEWKGWYKWTGHDPFEDAVGPFYVRRDEQGIVTGFRPGPANRNGHGSIHGGCMMTFADFSLFMIAGSGGAEVSGVTVAFTCEFVGPAMPGQLLEARGEVTRAGRSLVFVRGLVTADGANVLSFSGTLKRSTAPSSH
jgi:acyl-coenzyme A thioesterase PaaI-like protein